MDLKFLIAQFLLFQFLQKTLGDAKFVMLGAVLLTLVYFVVNLIVTQESMLYVPHVVPAGHPMAKMTPKDEGLRYEDVYLKTSDGLTLHAWFIYAPDKWTIQTVDIAVRLENVSGGCLGVEFKVEGKELIVGAVNEDGAAAKWNADHPDKKFMPGDLVLEVNGCEGDSDALLQEVRQSATISIKLQRCLEVWRPTILFLHENAGSIALRVSNFRLMADKLGVNILALDYRGYGKSEGTPSEDGLIEDARCAWEWIQSAAKAGRLDRQQIFVSGRSLGGAVAVALVSMLTRQENELPEGIILENTFVSIGALVDTLFPFLAYESLKKKFLRLRWETINRIKDISVPLLFISGAKDELIPAWHMKSLHSAAAKATLRRSIIIPEGMHNDTWQKGGDAYWEAQAAFFKDCREGVEAVDQVIEEVH